MPRLDGSTSKHKTFMNNPPSRSALLFALLFALLSTAAAACLAGTPGSAPELLPAQGCVVGDVRHTDQGNWMDSRGLAELGDPAVQVYPMVGDNGPASALRVAMNAAALNNVTKVEVQDAQGNWEPVWSGRYAAPAGCADVWFEHSLAGSPRVVKAVRLGFVLDRMPMSTGRAGLLRAR
jgi:hypothetical protein